MKNWGPWLAALTLVTCCHFILGHHVNNIVIATHNLLG